MSAKTKVTLLEDRLRRATRENQQLRRQVAQGLPLGYAELRRLAPEFEELRRLLSWATAVADPVRGVNYDRAGSVSAERPSEGAGTVGERGRVDRWRRVLSDVVYEFGRELDPEQYPPGRKRRTGGPGPRCQRRTCDREGKRQEPGQTHCGWCGNAFTEAQLRQGQNPRVVAARGQPSIEPVTAGANPNA